MEITLLTLLMISIFANGLLYKRLKEEELALEKRKQLIKKAEIGMQDKLDELTHLDNDYLEDEKVYIGIAGGDR